MTAKNKIILHIKPNNAEKNQWLRHPLFIAFLSSFIFALIVTGIGSYLQQKSKLFDKKVEIAKNIFYYNALREENVYNIYSAISKRRDHTAYWFKAQEINALSTALDIEIEMYLGDEANEIRKNFYNLSNKWHNIEIQLDYYDNKQKTLEEIKSNMKKISMEGVNINNNISENLINIINTTFYDDLMNYFKRKMSLLLKYKPDNSTSKKEKFNHHRWSKNQVTESSRDIPQPEIIKPPN